MDENSTPTMEDLRAAFGLTEEAAEDTPADVPAEAPAESESAEAPAESAEAPAESAEAQQTESPNAGAAEQFRKNNQQQAQYAFAKMRTENAAMAKSMQATAQILGLDPRMPVEKLAVEIQKAANNAIAKKQNVDPAIYNRLTELEEINARYQRAEVEKNIMQSLDTIKKRFGATDDDLTVFVQTLDSEGYNPFVPGANLVNEFIQRNFDTILNNRVNAAIQEEQARAAKAGGASKPSAKQGQEDSSEPKEIKTQAEFDSFMDSLSK